MSPFFARWSTAWAWFLLPLTLMACDAMNAHTQMTSGAAWTRPVAPRTLESTLRLPNDLDEIQFYPEIASNARGDLVAVWEQFDGEQYSIWGNSRLAGQEWGRATLIEANQSGHAYNPRLALNPYGSAMAVWVQADDASGTSAVWSNRFEAATGWGNATPIDGRAASTAYLPHVAIDERGHATAAWQHGEGRERTIRANRYQAGSGWGTASRLAVGPMQHGALKVSILASGEPQIVWQEASCAHGEVEVDCPEQGAEPGQPLFVGFELPRGAD